MDWHYFWIRLFKLKYFICLCQWLSCSNGAYCLACVCVNVQSFESIQRARLMQGTASLNRASDSLARSHLVAAETDQIGTDIIDELGTQRESLLRTREAVSESSVY